MLAMAASSTTAVQLLTGPAEYTPAGMSPATAITFAGYGDYGGYRAGYGYGDRYGAYAPRYYGGYHYGGFGYGAAYGGYRAGFYRRW
jgi:hypothetical protein